MDFFRSILSDDPDPETRANSEHSGTDSHQIQSPIYQSTTENDEDDDSISNINSSEDGSSAGAGGGVWSFGDLVKTLTTKSESVFETYRRDLQEFGTGLRKESDLFREVASRAVKELPEVGTSAIDGVLKSTADIIAQGKEVLLAPNSDVDDSDASGKRSYSNDNYNDSNSRRYSRFDMQLNAIRSDVRTYCEDPEDLEDYNKWKLGFVVGDKKDEIEKLVGENRSLSGMYVKIVPNEVDDGTFWFRYFYKVYKLEQQDDMRAKFVKRSLSVDDEEELSWDVDDDDDVDEEKEKEEESKSDHLKLRTSKGEDLQGVGKNESVVDELKKSSSNSVDEEKEMTADVVSIDKDSGEETKSSGGNVFPVEKAESVPKSDETVDHKMDSAEVKDSNVVVKSNQPSVEKEEDLEWDEIEDIGNNDDKKVSHGETTDKVELRKRLSTAADEEDLIWDIEDDDDDEPAKAGNK